MTLELTPQSLGLCALRMAVDRIPHSVLYRCKIRRNKKQRQTKTIRWKIIELRTIIHHHLRSNELGLQWTWQVIDDNCGYFFAPVAVAGVRNVLWCMYHNIFVCSEVLSNTGRFPSVLICIHTFGYLHICMRIFVHTHTYIIVGNKVHVYQV